MSMIKDAIDVSDVTWMQLQTEETYRCKATIVPEAEGGFSVFAIDLPGVASQGETIEEAKANIKDALIEAIRSYKDADEEIPWGAADIQKTADSVEISVTVNV